MYKLIKNKLTGELSCVLREDGAFIPLDSSNTDYQEYLKWLEEGGVPEAADDVPAQ